MRATAPSRPVSPTAGRVARCDRDAGSGVVLVLGLVAVAAGVALALAALGGAILARHRAESAADLAALAGAAAPAGRECPTAASIVARAGAGLRGCWVGADGSVAVVVSAPLPRWIARWAGEGGALARARAGTPPAGGPAGVVPGQGRGPPRRVTRVRATGTSAG